MMSQFEYFNRLKTLNRKKPDPAKFIYTGLHQTEETDIQLFEYSDDWFKEQQNLQASAIGDLRAKKHNSWLNINGLSDADLVASICKNQGIDNLAIQDILDLNQRPKFQEFDNFYFLTIKSTVPSEEQMDIEQISFAFNHNYLISFQEKKADHFEHLRFRIRENKGIIRQRGPDLLLYTLIESILDNYFTSLDLMSKEVERMNLENIKSEPLPSLLEEVERHKIFVHFIKNAIQPIKEFAQVVERKNNPFIEDRNLKFYYEIKDLSLTLLDRTDTLLAMLESSTNLFFSLQGHRMNQVMKFLTIVATIFIPLTFVAGIYGMNFENMPELKWRYGYAGVWVTMWIIFAGMIFYFRRKKWL